MDMAGIGSRKEADWMRQRKLPRRAKEMRAGFFHVMAGKPVKKRR